MRIVRQIVAALLLQRWDTSEASALGLWDPLDSTAVPYYDLTKARREKSWHNRVPHGRLMRQHLKVLKRTFAKPRTKHVMQYRGDFKGGYEQQQNTLNAEIPKPGLSTTEAIS